MQVAAGCAAISPRPSPLSYAGQTHPHLVGSQLQSAAVTGALVQLIGCRPATAGHWEQQACEQACEQLDALSYGKQLIQTSKRTPKQQHKRVRLSRGTPSNCVQPVAWVHAGLWHTLLCGTKLNLVHLVLRSVQSELASRPCRLQGTAALGTSGTSIASTHQAMPAADPSKDVFQRARSVHKQCLQGGHHFWKQAKSAVSSNLCWLATMALGARR